jgi:2-hydroxychromene-2-carboxylate isomerase
LKVNSVDLYFDFVSPYSYLAMTQVQEFGIGSNVHWVLRPVVYGALLDANGLVGPAEVASKRRYTFQDVSRAAILLGVPLIGPPAHPFRSLEALRTVCLFQDSSAGLRLCVALSRACWGEGRDVSSVEVIADVVATVGLPAEDLQRRIAAPEVKGALRTHTEQALAAGVFGVPTFGARGQLFWGHDRLPQLAALLDGTLDDDAVEIAAGRMQQRPRGTDRGKAPLAGNSGRRP